MICCNILIPTAFCCCAYRKISEVHVAALQNIGIDPGTEVETLRKRLPRLILEYEYGRIMSKDPGRLIARAAEQLPIEERTDLPGNLWAPALMCASCSKPLYRFEGQALSVPGGKKAMVYVCKRPFPRRIPQVMSHVRESS
jgi:hypothetical protein